MGDLGLAKNDTPGPVHQLPGTMCLEPTMSCGPVTSDIGTFAYMAPEQRHSHYDQKVDMYALGMLLWEMNEKQENHDERHTALMRTRRTGKVGWWCEVKSPESIEIIEQLIQ